MLEKYQTDKNLKKVLKISDFVQTLDQNREFENPSHKFKKLKLNLLEKGKMIDTHNDNELLLMKDEFSAWDLHFEKIKQLYEREIKGPNLKQLDLLKKLQDSQKELIESSTFKCKIKPKDVFDWDSINFLIPDFQSKVLSQHKTFIPNEDYKKFERNLELFQ